MNSKQQRTWLLIIAGILLSAFMCCLFGLALGSLIKHAVPSSTTTTPTTTSAELTIAVSPGMGPTLQQLAEQFNAQQHRTPDGKTMQVRTISLSPEKIVAQSLAHPDFQAIAPDSSLWLNQLNREWEAQQNPTTEEKTLIPIGSRRFDEPIRYAVSPVVIAAWQDVATQLGWPNQPVGWADIQRAATENPNFKWNHPGTGYASGLLATLAEFYAGTGLTRGLTPEAATAQTTIDYVRAVEATVQFYGEGEDVIVQRLEKEGRNFLDAFVTQENVVVAWNQAHPDRPLVAIYPAEGTLWADHPLALLELGEDGETPVSDNQRRTYQAFAAYLLSSEAQQRLLQAGYRPADLSIRLDEGNSPFANTQAVDWRQPQTTLQIPSEAVVEVVQNVWWYTKRPTNVYLVVDTSGSMAGTKMRLTKAALRSFVQQIRGDRDQVGLITFSSGVRLVRPLQPLDEGGRQSLLAAIDDLDASGETALVDGIWEAFDDLQQQGDAEAINALVVMTDGHENSSHHRISELRQHLTTGSSFPVVVFTIAFGNGADEKLLRSFAESGGGQFRRADETDIEELYKIISTYF